ncbi:hypothetical protein Tco_0982327 [Tanacetum coccineum]
MFEMYCRALNVIPTVPLFRVFYKLCKQGNWFSFQSRVGKNCKPCFKYAPTSLKKWKDKFFLVDRRAAPIAMPLRHHDSSVADPFPKPEEFDASDIEKLCEVVIILHKLRPSLLYIAGLSHVWKNEGHIPILKGSKEKVLTMAEFLRLPNFRGCRWCPLAIWCYLGDSFDSTSQPSRGNFTKNRGHEDCGGALQEGEGASLKKIKTRQGASTINLDSEHVSSPTPINHSKPLEALANEEHVYVNASTDRLDALRNQTDEHGFPRRKLLDFIVKYVHDQATVDTTVICHGYSEKDKNKGKTDKPSTGLERA